MMNKKDKLTIAKYKIVGLTILGVICFWTILVPVICADMINGILEDEE